MPPLYIAEGPLSYDVTQDKKCQARLILKAIYMPKIEPMASQNTPEKVRKPPAPQIFGTRPPINDPKIAPNQTSRFVSNIICL
ncbi:hypothetical protein BH11PAT3_BH11PAT3_3340 [soil metagenome]